MQKQLGQKGFIKWPEDYNKEFCFCENKEGNPEQTR